MKEVYYHLAVIIKSRCLVLISLLDQGYRSIDTLLSAGKLEQPTFTRKAVLNFEHFEIETGTWKNVMTVECKVERAKSSFFSCSTNISRGLSAYKP